MFVFDVLRRPQSESVYVYLRVLIVVVAKVIIVCGLNSARIGIDKQTK